MGAGGNQRAVMGGRAVCRLCVSEPTVVGICDRPIQSPPPFQCVALCTAVSPILRIFSSVLLM